MESLVVTTSPIYATLAKGTIADPLREPKTHVLE